MFLNATSTVFRNPKILLMVFVTLLVGFSLLSWYDYQINPDATSYISIAQKYAAGDIRHAINGYWGPLISWLLVPFIWLGINPIVGAKVILLLSGIGVVLMTYALMTQRYKYKKNISLWAIAGMIPVILAWSMPSPITPDLIFTLILVTELYALNYFIERKNLISCILLGLAGSFLYFSKFFGAYFFIGQIVIFFLCDSYITKSPRKTIKPYAFVGLTFMVIILPFLLALSLKYDHLTVSTAGKYNQGIAIISGNDVGLAHPMVSTGPFPPPNDSAYSVWEDPSDLPVPDNSPFQSGDKFIQFLQVMWRNILRIREALLGFGLIVILGMFIILLHTRKANAFAKLNIKSPYFQMGITALMLIMGYSLVIVEQRYLWGIYIIGAISLTGYLSKHVREHSAVGLLILIALLNSWTYGQNIIDSRDVGLGISNEANAISDFIPAESRVISDNFASIYACYYNNLRCYSVLNPGQDTNTYEQLYTSLKNQNINYLIDYHSKETDKNYVGFRSIYYTKIGEVISNPEKAMTKISIYKIL